MLTSLRNEQAKHDATRGNDCVPSEPTDPRETPAAGPELPLPGRRALPATEPRREGDSGAGHRAALGSAASPAKGTTGGLKVTRRRLLPSRAAKRRGRQPRGEPGAAGERRELPHLAGRRRWLPRGPPGGGARRLQGHCGRRRALPVAQPVGAGG